MTSQQKRPIDEANDIMLTVLLELNYLIESEEYKIRVAKRLGILHANAMLNAAHMGWAYLHWTEYWTDVISHINSYSTFKSE